MAAKIISEDIPVEKLNKDMDAEVESEEQPLMNGPTQPKESQRPQSGSIAGAMEQNFLGRFMSPMMSQMEASAQKNIEKLDEIQRDLDNEREERMRANASEHIPHTIKEYGQELPEIMNNLEHLIIYENYETEEEDESKHVKAKLKKMDANSEVCVLSHSISAYVSTLEPSHLKHLANRVVSDTAKWLTTMFRMDNSSAYFHEDETNGLLKVCKLAMYRKYPNYINDGYQALHDSAPVIYISAASRPELGQLLCSQLGLPSSSVCLVPLYNKTHKMDVKALIRLVEGDSEAGKTPVMVVAYAGTPVLGHVDELGMLRDVCRKNKLWLHLEGNNIALLTYFNVPSDIRPVASGDSLGLNLGGWLGIPAVPYVTLYQNPEEVSHARAAGLLYYNAKYKLNCMPLWISMQNIGHYGIVDKIKYAVNMSTKVHEHIETLDTIRNVSKNRNIEPQETFDERHKELNRIGKMMARVVDAITYFQLENPTVVFRYVHRDQNEDYLERKAEAEEKEKKAKEEISKKTSPKKKESAKKEDKPVETEAETPKEEEEEKPWERNPYYDALNIWLCETLKRDCPKVHIAAIEIANEGICIRFAPMESIHDYDTTEEELENFLKCLSRQLSILDATVKHRHSFAEIVQAQDNLRLINLTNWAGLGAVQYVPTSQVNNLANLNELGQTEINKVNYELVQQLKSSDTAFSLGKLGQGSERLFCVRFGLVTQDTDLEELIGLVYSTGKQVEESTTFLESMAENIRKGIEKAQEDLVKENQDKLANEGALRQLPLVGSLMNWWSPPAKEGIKGRSFNLASGKIASTEETYKYKMQIQAEGEGVDDATSSTVSSPPGGRPRVGSYKASLQPVGGASRQTSNTSDHQRSVSSSSAPPSSPKSGKTENSVEAQVANPEAENSSDDTSEVKSTDPTPNTDSVPPSSTEQQEETDDLK